MVGQTLRRKQMSIKVNTDVAKLLQTEEGRQRLIALKLCELVEIMKCKQHEDKRSMWECIFGHKGNE